MKLIAGLGNPGSSYALTRHNIGYMALDRISTEAGITLQERSANCITGCGSWCGHEIILAKPLTFMNRSGEAIAPLAERFALRTEDILIIHDDMDFPFGSIRIKASGGSGGHRGVASIIDQLATDLFLRVRIGIGRPPAALSGPDYVLESFTDGELELLGTITAQVGECVETIFKVGIAAAMNKFHTADRQHPSHGL